MIGKATLAAAAAAGLVLSPFGKVSDLLSTKSVWRGFDSKDSVLLIVRAEQTTGSSSCSAWTSALSLLSDGHAFNSASPPKERFSDWEPFSDDDLDAIRDCEKFPCKMKLDSKEVSILKSTSKVGRKDRFFSLIRARTSLYEKTQERKPYEFPGKPVDPWTEFEKRGFRSSLVLPAQPELWIRQLDLSRGKFKPVDQILDRRVAVGPNEATLWIRDVYSSHYADSYGEWIDVSCDSSSHQIVVLQAVLVDFDQLKETDLFSKIGAGKIRSGIESHFGNYMDRKFEKLKKLALAGGN